ncbi:MAG: hypothetical protein WD795_02995 [Woeseia sp.]
MNCRSSTRPALALARHAQSYAETHDGWEVVTPATLGVLTCRYRAAGASSGEIDRLNALIAGEVSCSGYAYVTTTELGGRTVLRFCPIHPGANEQDIEETFARLEQAASRAGTSPLRA